MKKLLSLMVAALAGPILAVRLVEVEESKPAAGVMQKGKACLDKRCLR